MSNILAFPIHTHYYHEMTIQTVSCIVGLVHTSSCRLYTLIGGLNVYNKDAS